MESLILTPTPLELWRFRALWGLNDPKIDSTNGFLLSSISCCHLSCPGISSHTSHQECLNLGYAMCMGGGALRETVHHRELLTKLSCSPFFSYLWETDEIHIENSHDCVVRSLLVFYSKSQTMSNATFFGLWHIHDSCSLEKSSLPRILPFNSLRLVNNFYQYGTTQ